MLGLGRLRSVGSHAARAAGEHAVQQREQHRRAVADARGSGRGRRTSRVVARPSRGSANIRATTRIVASKVDVMGRKSSQKLRVYLRGFASGGACGGHSRAYIVVRTVDFVQYRIELIQLLAARLRSRMREKLDSSGRQSRVVLRWHGKAARQHFSRPR